MTNSQISKILRECSIAYSLVDPVKYRFQSLAYQKSADAIDQLGEPLESIIKRENIEVLPGIGKSIASHIKDLIDSGRSKHLEEIRAKVPEAVYMLVEIQGIGAKKAYKLTKELSLNRENALDKLRENILNNKISQIEGFGVESQKDLLSALDKFVSKPPRRFLLNEAHEVSFKLIDYIKLDRNIESIDVLGSLRRKSPTIGDIDISIATKDISGSFDHIHKYPLIEEVIERGDRSTSFKISGIQIDIMAQPKERYGSLLQHFTGSKYHNVALREYALGLGLSLSEYGIKPLKNQTLQRGVLEEDTYKYKSESDFYLDLGLDYIEPEIRENRGEIEAALSRKLPKLVERGDIKGDLHMHSSWNIETSHDLGMNSIEEMAQKAILLGYEYIAITDHNPSQKGHNEDGFARLLKERSLDIKKVQSGVKNLRIFNSLEIDITPNGDLAIPDSSLEILDFGIVSIHSRFDQDQKTATARVIKALGHKKVLMLAHPTGRILGKRDGINLDWEKVFSFCRENHKVLEVNSSYDRLDLPDDLIKKAIDYGVAISINTDSHAESALDSIEYGVWNARKGWAETQNVLNALPLSKFLKTKQVESVLYNVT